MKIEEKISARQKKIDDYYLKIKKEEEKISDFQSKVEQLKLEIEQITNEEMNHTISQIDAEPLEFIALIKEMKKHKLKPNDTLEILKELGKSDTQETNTTGYGA
ncbi:MAG: hypothetical protein ACRCR5_06125 [Lactococcus garvieae]